MMWSPLLMIASSICMIITHLSGSVNCFVLPSYNIPFGTQKRLAPATGTASGDEDFASFNSEDGGDDGMQLASEFYQELEYRRKHGEETYTVSEPKQRKMFSTQTRQNAATQKPAVSAGLFSGGGSTVYSSGRSIRAEIDILNRSMTEDTKGMERWNVDFELSPEQMENLLKILGFWGGASTITLFNDAAKDGITSMISVGKGEVFMGDEAAWLIKESSALSASIVDAVTSVERIVLF
eukprot:scaffold5437_cov137-Skeletonema_menzelii.AAC.8